MNGLAMESLVHGLEPAIAEQLGTDLDDAREVALVALYAIARRPELYSATKESLTAAVLTCARMKLVPGLGLGYLAVERDDKNGLEAIFVPTYIGFIDLLERCANLRDVRARLVFSEDRFRLHYGTNERLEHRPTKRAQRGALLGAYAVGRLEDGQERFEALFRNDIDPVTPDGSSPPESARGKSIHDYGEWLKGVAVKRLAKWFTRTPEIAAAVELERASEQSKVRPRAVDVARMLGIDIPREEETPQKSPGSYAEVAKEIDEEASAVAQDREEEGPWCCACDRSVKEVGPLRTLSVNPSLWRKGSCPEHPLTKHRLCTTCTEQYAKAEHERLAAQEERLKVERRIEAHRVKRIKRDKGSDSSGASAPESKPTAVGEKSSTKEPPTAETSRDEVGPPSELTIPAAPHVDPTPTPPFGVLTALAPDWGAK